MLLSKEQILSVSDLPTETVEVPQWGGSVCVRGLTASERDGFEDAIRVSGMANLRARLAAMTIVDEMGTSIFSEADIDVLGRKSAEALDVVAQVATRLSGLTQEAVDVLEKN